MTARGDGGPAFPRFVPQGQPVYDDACGMTLRDYFAAAAVPSLLSFALSPAARVSPTNAETAEFAYAIADAMLAERAK